MAYDTKGIKPNAFANILNPYANTLNPNAAPGDTHGVMPVNQSLADAYSASNPTWAPPPAINAQLPHPIQPTTFNPWADPSFIFGAAGIEQGQQLAQGNFNYGTGTQGPQNFGYTPGLQDVPNDPNDPSKGTHQEYTGSISLQDPSAAGYNPFNQAATLQRSYDNSKRGTTNSYAASGQLYAGSYKNAQTSNTYNFNHASDQIQRGAQDYYQGLQTNVDSATGGKFTQLILNSLAPFLTTQKGS